MEVSRRTAALGLGLAPLVGVVGGCGSDPAGPGQPEPGGDAADLGLVRAALGEERAVLDLCRRAGRRHDRLAELVEAAARSHRQHERLLTGAMPERPTQDTSLPLPADPRRALAALVEAERRLSRAHVRRSMAAASGPLARVLASMAAAASQQAQVLSEGRAGGDSRRSRR